MNKYDLFRALTEVDDSLLAEVENSPKKRRPARYLIPLAASCACVAIAFLAIQAFGLPGMRTKDSAAVRSGNSPEQFAQMENRFDPLSPPEAPAENAADAQTEAITRDTDPATADGNGSYGTYPQDFSFSLTWPEGSYDSGTGLLTAAGGEVTQRSLSPEELQSAWNLLSGLEMTQGGRGDWTLTVTQDGVTQTMEFSQDDYGPALSICTELIRLLEGDVSQ